MIINNGDKINPLFIEVLTAYIELSNIMRMAMSIKFELKTAKMSKHKYLEEICSSYINMHIYNFTKYQFSNKRM